jgi:hypothetical protein
MAISPISLSNTFGQWIIATNATVNQLNLLSDGNYTKSTGTIYINSPGVGVQVASNANFQGYTRFYDDVQFDKLVRVNNLSISGESTVSGTYVKNDAIILRCYTTTGNATIIVNRGEFANVANANAEIRWNNYQKHWEARDVNNPSNYFKLITKADYATTTANGIVTLNDNILVSSTVQAATANTVKITYDTATSAFTRANIAYAQANTGIIYANSAFMLGQTAFAQANTGISFTQNVFQRANMAYTQANSGITFTSSVFNQANTAYGRGNTAYNFANTAYDLANNAGFFTTTTSVNKTLIKREKCIVTANNLVLDLPPSPSDSTPYNDWVVIVSVGAFTNTNLARNGANVESISDDLRIDVANTTVALSYINSTIGWKT